MFLQDLEIIKQEEKKKEMLEQTYNRIRIR